MQNVVVITAAFLARNITVEGADDENGKRAQSEAKSLASMTVL